MPGAPGYGPEAKRTFSGTIPSWEDTSSGIDRVQQDLSKSCQKVPLLSAALSKSQLFAPYE